jgi:ubiquinone/menaquinone biosynthesis C-methylase UbiE
MPPPDSRLPAPTKATEDAQAFSVKRAEVEFHNFASLGQPERVLAKCADDNLKRAGFIRKHLKFIGPLTPFLEIGANAGHTSCMMATDFGADGFALDISADALRYGAVIQDRMGYERGPVRIAGDALHLPFADGSLQLVMAYQMLSQFMDIERVFVEVKRVLAPGGVFLLSDEPLLRMLTLRLYRCPYYDTMKPWERKLHDWGLLGYLVRDVIGAHQEQSFGIRQNHTMALVDWTRLIEKHFAACEYDLYIRQQGWGERWMKNLALTERRAAKWLGGTLAAVCRKAGQHEARSFQPFERLLRCPDCGGAMARDEAETLRCGSCPYETPLEDGVYNLLHSSDKAELYPGDRADIIDFSLPGHEERLGAGWHQLEGVFGNRWRWMSALGEARLGRVKAGPQRLRIRGHAFDGHVPIGITVRVNEAEAGRWTLDRSGMFVLEADVEDSEEYRVTISADPAWTVAGDDRTLSVTVGMIRLVPRE